MQDAESSFLFFSYKQKIIQIPPAQSQKAKWEYQKALGLIKGLNFKPFQAISPVTQYSNSPILQLQALNFLSTHSWNFHWQKEVQRKRTKVQDMKLGFKRKKPKTLKRSQRIVTLADTEIWLRKKCPKNAVKESTV